MRLWYALAWMGLTAGCGVLSEPAPSDKQLAIIDIGQPQIFLSTPDTVAAGPVVVHYNSFGSSSCNIPAGEAVAATSGTVTIIAYDRYVPPQSICTEDLATYHRTVPVTLTTGTVTVVLQGIRATNNYQVGEFRKMLVVR
jgi:hypothetical protein